jgi:hypothetical protein
LEVFVDGQPIAAAVLHDGRALAPVREVAEALGARVDARLAEGEVHLFTPGFVA